MLRLQQVAVVYLPPPPIYCTTTADEKKPPCRRSVCVAFNQLQTVIVIL